MGLQKFRADEADAPEPNGSVAWWARWMGGPSLAKVQKCLTPWGPKTVYAADHPDTFFSIPARMEVSGVYVKGYLSREDGEGWKFTPYEEYRLKVSQQQSKKRDALSCKREGKEG